MSPDSNACYVLNSNEQFPTLQYRIFHYSAEKRITLFTLLRFFVPPTAPTRIIKLAALGMQEA